MDLNTESIKEPIAVRHTLPDDVNKKTELRWDIVFYIVILGILGIYGYLFTLFVHDLSYSLAGVFIAGAIYIILDQLLKRFGHSFFGSSSLRRLIWILVLIVEFYKLIVSYIFIFIWLPLAGFMLREYIRFNPYENALGSLKKNLILFAFCMVASFALNLIFMRDNLWFCFSAMPSIFALYFFLCNIKCANVIKNQAPDVKKSIYIMWIIFYLLLLTVILYGCFSFEDQLKSYYDINTALALTLLAIDRINFLAEYVPEDRYEECVEVIQKAKRREMKELHDHNINLEVLEYAKKIAKSSLFNQRNLLLWTTVIGAIYSILFDQFSINFSDDNCTINYTSDCSTSYESRIPANCTDYLNNNVYSISAGNGMQQCSDNLNAVVGLLFTLTSSTKFCFFFMLFISLRSAKMMNKYRIIMFSASIYFKQQILSDPQFRRIMLMLLFSQLVTIGYIWIQLCQYIPANGSTSALILCKSMDTYSSWSTVITAMLPGYLSLLVVVYNNLSSPIHNFFVEGDETNLVLRDMRLQYEVDVGMDKCNLYRIRQIFKVGKKEKMEDLVRAVMVELDELKLMNNVKTKEV